MAPASTYGVHISCNTIPDQSNVIVGALLENTLIVLVLVAAGLPDKSVTLYVIL